MLLYKSNSLTITRNRVTSGGSRKKTIINFNLLLNKNLKCLSSRTSWKAGTSRLGKRTVLSKGRRLLSSKTLLCSYMHLDKSLHLHHSYFFNSSTKNIYALLYSSSGKVSYIRNLPVKSPFQLLKIKSYQSVFADNYDTLIGNKLSKFNVVSSALLYIRFMTKVTNLQASPGGVIKYSRSSGSQSIILKKNMQLSSSIVKLPSGVRKIFSSFSSCSMSDSRNSFKTFLFNSSSKELVNKGLAPRSRGVAKNPVDHPHGGRTKALRYPRTPWGKTTKFK